MDEKLKVEIVQMLQDEYDDAKARYGAAEVAALSADEREEKEADWVDDAIGAFFEGGHLNRLGLQTQIEQLLLDYSIYGRSDYQSLEYLGFKW